MEIALKILDGPKKGQKYRIFAGATLGRKKADINLGDSKASSRHARVEETPDGHLIIVDNGSRNGLFLPGGKVQKIPLRIGLVFYIGDSKIEVIDGSEVKQLGGRSSQGDWQSALTKFNEKMTSRQASTRKSVHPMTPPVELEVIAGQQLSTRWVLGYGPRIAGAASLDMPVFETGAPDICFEVLPSPKGPIFKADEVEKVKLNNRPTKSEKLSDGDVISIGNTIIRVKLLDV